MSKIKRILVKSLLCLSLVLGATLFISFDADASCWTKTKEGWGGCACDGTDSEWACWSINGECILGCDGHSYPYGIESWAEDIDYGRDLFGDYHTHHIHYWAWCELCNHVIQLDQYDKQYHHYHNWIHGGKDEWVRGWDQCAVYNKHIDTAWCPDCGAYIEGEPSYTFLWWDHCNNVHWAETWPGDGTGSYHALTCDSHGWINPADTSWGGKDGYHGDYVGKWGGLTLNSSNNGDNQLSYYKHNYYLTGDSDETHHKYHCNDCGREIDRFALLEADNTNTDGFSDNNLGRSTFNTAIDGKWVNHDVKLNALYSNILQNGNIIPATWKAAWIFGWNEAIISQEGTSAGFTTEPLIYMDKIADYAKTHTVKIDKTAPKLTGTSVKAGTYQAPATTSTAHDSESYGLKVTLKADDSNANARGGVNDVAKIKEAYVIVRDKDNANNSKRYNIDGVADKVSINTSKVIDVNKDFHGVLDFVYEIHVIDYAGNDAVKTDTIIRNPEVFLSVKNVTQNTQLNGSNVFLGGEHGILTITTTGYCDISNLKWNNYTLKASEKEGEVNYPTMNYNQQLVMKPYTTTTSGFKLATNGEYYPTLQQNACYTPDGGYTRIYEFVFWTPFEHHWLETNGTKPFISPSGKYAVEATGTNKKYNRKAKGTSYYVIDGDKITDKFRSSLIF